MLFTMFALVSKTGTSTERQAPTCTVGTKATTGANIPATLSSTSSASVLPLITTRQTPIATNAPTNTPCAGV